LRESQLARDQYGLAVLVAGQKLLVGDRKGVNRAQFGLRREVGHGGLGEC
jgi:hypothetical protein